MRTHRIVTVLHGGTLRNLWHRCLGVMTVGSNSAKNITFQVADVHKRLLGVSRLVDIANVSNFSTEGAWLEDKHIGEWVSNEEKALCMSSTCG